MAFTMQALFLSRPGQASYRSPTRSSRKSTKARLARVLTPPYALSQSSVALIFLAYAFGACGASIMGGMVARFGRARILCIALTIGVLLTLLALRGWEQPAGDRYLPGQRSRSS